MRLTTSADTVDTAEVAEMADAANAEAAPLLRLETINQQTSGARIVGMGLAQRVALKTDRNGSPYLALTVLCADGGTVEARWWRYPYATDRCPEQGVIWLLDAHVSRYQGVPQLQLVSAAPAAESVEDIETVMSAFVRTSYRPLTELQQELEVLISELDTELASLVRAVLSGDVYERYCEWPAAQSHHGAVRHGLLAHSIRVARLAQRIADAYGPGMLPHDAALVTAATLLHDIGKIATLPRIAGGALPDEGFQLDHVTRSVLMTQAAAARLDTSVSEERLANLLHTIAAHHGAREWGAPVEPHSVEAWLVHVADLAEARLWQWSEEA